MKNRVVCQGLLSGLAVLSVTTVLTATPEQVQAAALTGNFSSVVIPPPVCSSPVGLCTLGQLTGDVEGTYEFTALTIQNDPVNPNKQFFTGSSLIQTGEGSLFGSDSGFLQFTGAGLADFVTNVDITGGTEGFSGVDGEFLAVGTLNLSTGNAVGTYTANLEFASVPESNLVRSLLILTAFGGSYLFFRKFNARS